MGKIYQKMYPENKSRSKSVLGALFNEVILKSCNSGISPYFKHNGFTLAEILVVILIVGILAAMALPQYEKAVHVTRVTTLLPLMRSISDAQNRYVMANGKYARSFRSLDIQMPAGGVVENTNKDGERLSYANFYCYFHVDEDKTPVSLYCKDHKMRGLSLEKYFRKATFLCWAGTNDEKANVVCQSVSGMDTPNAGTSAGNGYTF